MHEIYYHGMPADKRERAAEILIQKARKIFTFKNITNHRTCEKQESPRNNRIIVSREKLLPKAHYVQKIVLPAVQKCRHINHCRAKTNPAVIDITARKEKKHKYNHKHYTDIHFLFIKKRYDGRYR